MAASAAVFFRRAELSDAPGIASLVTAATVRLFGEGNIVSIIEKAIFSVTAVNADGAVVGHAAFYDDPGVPGVPAAKWEDHVVATYEQGASVRPATSLFLRLLVTAPGFEGPAQTLTRELLRVMFAAVPDVTHVYCLLDSEALAAGGAGGLGAFFQPLARKAGSSHSDMTLCACGMQPFSPALLVRPARPEDFDQLTPIFNRQSEALKVQPSHFFLAEVIARQDADSRALTAEAPGGAAVGFAAVTRKLNLAGLVEHYDLDAFHNLQSLQLPVVAPAAVPAVAIAVVESLVDGVSKSDRELSSKSRSLLVSKSKTALASQSRTNLESKSRSNLVSKSRSSLGTVAPAAAAEPAPPAPPPKPEWKDSAFAVTLFGLAEAHEVRAIDLVAAAFAQFPQLDYCIMTVPSTEADFPLLQLMTHVRARPGTLAPHELFVVHRHALARSIAVQPLVKENLPAVEALVAAMDHGDLILADVHRYVHNGGKDPGAARRDPESCPARLMCPVADGTKIAAMVVLCAEEVVGLFVGRDAWEDASRVRAHFNVEEFILYSQHNPKDHLYLHHFVLAPSFERHAKFVLREAMRRANASCLYYRATSPDAALPATWQPNTPISAMHHFVPVTARRQVVIANAVLGSNAPSERIQAPAPHALLFLNRKLMLEPKITINARVVVVGSSDTGLAFLETLIFKSHLRFSNLVLLSPTGLAKCGTDTRAGQLLSNSISYTDLAQIQIAWQTWVNVVEDKMVGIDRAARRILLGTGACLPYDYLVLTPGLQYTPDSLESPAAESGAGGDVEKPALPPQVMVINEAADADELLNWIGAQFLPAENGSLLVYGASVDTLSVLRGLLAAGVPAPRLTYVTPRLPGPLETVALDLAMAALKDAGVAVHVGYAWMQWDESGDGDLAGAQFLNAATGAGLVVDCLAALVLDEKVIDEDLLDAAHGACLVFDERVVVNAAFQTNDLRIYAAGPGAKFSRKYHADAQPLQTFNSTEMGRALAASLLLQLDPLAKGHRGATAEQALAPTFSAFKSTLLLLPGGLQLLTSKSPTVAAGGQTLVTGAGTRRHFEIHLSPQGLVDSLVCLGEAHRQPVSNLLCLGGLHEKMLNNMAARFKEGLIPDFYAFFEMAWAMAVFHDRFRDFAAEITRGVLENPALNVAEFQKAASSADAGAGPEIQAAVKEAAKVLGAVSSPALVHEKLMDFLTYNSYHLPMFARPELI